jgi:uncharacterized protein YodC (DUF2158 family)
MTKRKPNIGDAVKLKSGGPAMVIERGGKEPKGRLVFQCVWIVDGVSRRDVFYADSLEHA